MTDDLAKMIAAINGTTEKKVKLLAELKQKPEAFDVEIDTMGSVKLEKLIEIALDRCEE